MNHVIIVESPAKARTLKKFLGAKYNVQASMGHVRDLPKKDIAIDVENNFEPTYEISPDKKKIVKELKDLIKKQQKHGETTVWLASDEDREGESIAWHLVSALDLDKKHTKRIAFHEITKPAILKALEEPREIDINLVHAQQARRVLDRLVGYKLSPVLWKKVKAGLSAGRVQSVSVRLIVEREREIEAFKPVEYWNIDADLKAEDGEFEAALTKIKGKKAVVSNKKEADKILADLKKDEFKVGDITKKETSSKPPAPFITSTLQQEASRKLGFSVKQTMMIAQQLYEGIDIGKEHTGLITYMRTDAFNLSGEFLKDVPKVIKAEYGDKYVMDKPRIFTKKAKGAQEAHEAIRPTHPERTPKSLKDALDAKQYKLYKLIWERTIAGQMPEAKYDTTNAAIECGDYTLTAKGKILKEAGYTKVYTEGVDHPDEEHEVHKGDQLLPDLKEGEVCDLVKIRPEQKFTMPPPRYTEASLVKKLESEGIGRPSTYAPTISTIINRGYVEKEEKKLQPTDLGLIVNDFLVEHFPDVVDYQFTAHVEEKLDKIADGDLEWQPVIEDFYKPFEKVVVDAEKNAEKATGERELGKDPKTGQRIIARLGRYGPMVQMGDFDENDETVKPRFAKIQQGQHINTITLEEALELFTLPRTLGEFEDKEVEANVGRFGPYVKHDNKFVSIKKDSGLDPHTIKLEEAIELIEAKRKEDKNKVIATYEYGKIQVLNGPYGPYIKADKKNYKIPKDKDAHTLQLDEIKDIIANAPEPRKYYRKKK